MTKAFLGVHAVTAHDDIMRLLHIHLKEYITERNITPQITVVDSPARVAIALLKSAHDWQPDFLGFWNIKADISKVIEAFEREGYDPAQYFSDPSVPPEYRFFNWREDTPYKTNAAGKQTPKHFSDLWHKVQAPSSFYCICLMATYRAVRARDPYRRNYKLDSVLHENIGIGKIHFDVVPDNLPQLDWHKEMQRNHKLEYMVYLAFDGIGVELLDEKTNDVSRFLRSTIGVSEFTNFKSNPKRLSDDMHMDLLNQGKVIGSTRKDMSDSFDQLTPTLKGWIITLMSELTHKIGRNLINEYPDQETNITTHAYDVDVKSAYPYGEICLNVGKSTRRYEVCGIKGLTTQEVRSFGINMTNVNGNALQLAKKSHGFPDPQDLLAAYREEKKRKAKEHDDTLSPA